MSETEPISGVEIQPEPDPIEVICQGECESLSGRSTLTYAIGRHPDGNLFMRLTGNSNGGMFCGDWITGVEIDAIVVGATELTAASFQNLTPGRSGNTGGFLAAAVRSLGLIRVSTDNSRHHEGIPTETFEKVVMARMGQASGAPKPGRRKKEA